MVTINIKKKDMFLISAIVVFLIGVGFVVAYNGNNPAVMGHTASEISGLSTSSGTLSCVTINKSCTTQDCYIYCSVAGTGYTVTGGGFIDTTSQTGVDDSRPTSLNDGWFVYNYYASPSLPISVYARCCKIV